MNVRVRFAPSPTGRMHIGNFRSALYDYLFAKKHGGVFVLRIEDTDRTRLVEGGVENIVRTLAAMGLSYEEGPFLKENGEIEQRGDKGPYIQSERLEIYREHIERLRETGHVYPCFCTPERLDEVRKAQEANKQPTGYDRHCRALPADEAEQRIGAGERHVFRFKMPDAGETDFHDLIRGPVKFRNDLLDDYVLLKGDGYPTYHLAAIVDDHLMDITHVIRGEEWLSSTPKHLLLYKAFGWVPPQFAHLPLLLNADRSKLSKRQGDVAVEDYLEQGYLPEAIANFAALLGWNPSDTREIYDLRELAEAFKLEDVNSAGAVFNREKLDWINGKYLRAMPLETLAGRARPAFERAGVDVTKLTDAEFGGLLALERERVKTLSELPEATAFLFVDVPDYPAERLCWKAQSREDALSKLAETAQVLEGLDASEFDQVTLEKCLKDMIETNGWKNGEVLWPLRVALSGREQSPGPFEIMAVLGKMKAIRRVKAGMDRLKDA